MGVGKAERQTVTPFQILATGIALGCAFLGTISLLLLITSTLING